VLDELLSARSNLVYIGEDVEHGGYYLVTEGLVAKYPLRVIDFPPDETSLIGAGVGFAHAGLLPIVEIPYAKYLDCGADMFAEMAVMNWLSNGRQPNGVVVRLQGFDRGVFGGNFHTHNALAFPPGLDVVCYSNGADYARGMRYLVRQAEAGRVCMSVDSTALLNERHLHEKDDGWLWSYPERDAEIDFDFVRVHRAGGRVAIVTYGNGVRTALRAARSLDVPVDVVDSPYLSSVSRGLREAVAEYEAVVFADVCKQGQGPLASHATHLHSEGALKAWNLVAAQRTYNPLGSTLTFLSEDDIREAVTAISAKL